MPSSFDLSASARAMHSHVLGMRSTDPHSPRSKPWSDALVPDIEAERESIRVDEGGGGMCHVVTEWLWDVYGWVRLPVSYLDPRGDVICAGHLICGLPDGSLLDPTADQFGEGHSVRVIAPGHADYGRYRPEFDADVNPASYPDVFAAFFWNGQSDFDAQDQLRADRGQGWWLTDKSAYIAYLEHQVKLGGDVYAYALGALKAPEKTPKTHKRR